MVRSALHTFLTCCSRHHQSTAPTYLKRESPAISPEKGDPDTPNFSPSNIPPKDAQYTTMTDKVRIALCYHQDKNPQLKHQVLIQRLQQRHKVKFSQPTLGGLLKMKATFLANADNNNLTVTSKAC